MTDRVRIALVSPDGESQREVASYLTRVGFEVHESTDLPIPTSFAALVLIGGTVERLVGHVRTWLRLTRNRRIVVVTAKPAALRSLVAVHGDRLFVLAAPAFAWDVVDALRANEQTFRPPGA